ncbi:hypothetical protein GCM10009540_76560 [Streptomyces turgidiscabies]
MSDLPSEPPQAARIGNRPIARTVATETRSLFGMLVCAVMVERLAPRCDGNRPGV